MKMTIINMFIAIGLFVGNAVAEPYQYVQVTDSGRNICTQKKPCHVNMSKNSKRYRILFKMVKDRDLYRVSRVQINNVTDNKKQVYKLPIINSLEMTEVAKLYHVDLNKDGYEDIALEAGLSAHKGETYLYWFYNPKTKSYVMTRELAPKLAVSFRGVIESQASSDRYKLVKYQLVEL